MHAWWEWVIVVAVVAGLSIWGTSAIARFAKLLGELAAERDRKRESGRSEAPRQP